MNLFSFKKDLFKTIHFKPHTEMIEAFEAPPLPSIKLMAPWYKKLPSYVNNTDIPFKSKGRRDVKTCSPFRDVMTAGYMYVTPVDIEVTSFENGDVDMNWNMELSAFNYAPVEKRGSILDPNNQGFGMPVPLGCNPIMFAWAPTYGSSAGLKYMALVTQPFNRHDLPFITTSGLVDTIHMGTGSGNIPFFIKQGFSGFIPKGTPYAQVIPIKRQNWKHKIDKANWDEYKKQILLRNSYSSAFYTKYIRKNKTFK